jgi:hypothetical protein
MQRAAVLFVPELASAHCVTWQLPITLPAPHHPHTAAAAVPNAKLSGRTLVQFYLYKNCSSKQSSSVQLEVNLTQSEKPAGQRVPVDNYNLTGRVFTRE